MALDWMPIRLNILRDPAVITIARLTGEAEVTVVGRLVLLWSWANENLSDGNAGGNALGVTVSWVDRYVGATGFARAMIAVHWLEAVPSENPTAEDPADPQVMFPKFDVWNAQGSKRRMDTAERVRRHRAKKAEAGNAGVTRDVTHDVLPTALPEKRREEKSNPQDPPTPRGAGGGAGEGPGHEFVELPEFGLLVEAWTTAGLAGAGKVQATSNRKGHWQQRHADPYWAANWRAAVERAGRSERCRPGGGWALALDTFLKDPDLVRRLLEGEFDTTAEGGIPRPAGANLDVIGEFRRKHCKPPT